MSVSETSVVTPRESTLSHLLTSLLFTVATVVVFGFIYPAVITLIGMVAFPHQAAGSLVRNAQGTVVGSQIIGPNQRKGRQNDAKAVSEPGETERDGVDKHSS